MKCKTISLAGRCQQVLANPAIYCTTGCSYEWKARVMAIWHKRSPPTNIWKCKHTQKLTTWMERWIKVHIIAILIKSLCLSSSKKLQVSAELVFYPKDRQNKIDFLQDEQNQMFCVLVLADVLSTSEENIAYFKKLCSPVHLICIIIGD